MSEFDKSAVKMLLRFGIGVAIFACTVFFFKYLLAPLLPFLLALLLSAIVTPFADKLKRRTRIPYKFWCIVLLIVFSLLLFALLWFLLSGVVKELSHFITNEQSVGRRLESLYSSVFRLIEKYLPSLYARIDRQAVNERLLSLLSELSVSASMHLARFAFSLPEVLLFAVITYLAAYYITVEKEVIGEKLFSFLRPDVRERCKGLFHAFAVSLKNYFKAGGMLLILTFCELLAGFMILRIDFPILFALVIAAVDFLPVLGTGTVLIPWGLVLVVAGEKGRGVGLLVLWLVTVIVRQLAEPRIYGTTLGIHPLLTLVATYFGLKLFGIGGMLTFPIVLAVISGMLKKEESVIQ